MNNTLDTFKMEAALLGRGSGGRGRSSAGRGGSGGGVGDLSGFAPVPSLESISVSGSERAE